MTAWTKLVSFIACVAFLSLGSTQPVFANGGSGAPDEINVEGDWETTGDKDEQNLFPNGTPGPGAVTIDNDGPGDVDVTVCDANGNPVPNSEGDNSTTVDSGTSPTFDVPSGGTVKVKGSNKKNADGTYRGSFSV